MPSALDILALSRSIPFKIGSWGVGKFIGQGRSALMDPSMGYSYEGTPISIPISPDAKKMGVIESQTKMYNDAVTEWKKPTFEKGSWWKKTPFLWSEVKTPILDTIPAGDLYNRELANFKMYGAPSEFVAPMMTDMYPQLAKDKNWRNVLIPAQSQIHTQAKLGLIADAISRLPENAPAPSAVKLFKSPAIMGMGNFYDQARNEVGLSSLHPLPVMHEFGHVADIGGSKWKAPWFRANNYLDRGLRVLVPAAMLGGEAIAKGIPGSVDDAVIGALASYGPEAWLAARATGPLMAEYNATRWANKQFADMEAKNSMQLTGDKLKTYRNLRLGNWAGFGKYLFNTAVPYGILSAVRHYVNKNKEIEKKSSVVDSAKAFTEEVLLRPWRGIKAMGGNMNVVLEPMVKPNLKNLGEMIKSDSARELAISAIAPTILGAALLASADERQQAALKDTEAAKLPYYKMLGTMYPGLDVAPWVLDNISERFLT